MKPDRVRLMTISHRVTGQDRNRRIWLDGNFFTKSRDTMFTTKQPMVRYSVAKRCQVTGSAGKNVLESASMIKSQINAIALKKDSVVTLVFLFENAVAKIAAAGIASVLSRTK